ncbi:EF-hand domain-containing protein [Sphingomonas sp. KR1UV-12]|uniref:EF-hand domain-containing protein n=1 Tax=Sphingomonas aurea TaxID=3063994 RepID=A0ABT9ENZ9_9SPHN|nr:EF-hand domain-containing protein [Sphingomonas sp. KR1UV-12]MDP1028671.1 EF-hand domain-containing protein [Sphingomonas sp. KR1UV-12]
MRRSSLVLLLALTAVTPAAAQMGGGMGGGMGHGGGHGQGGGRGQGRGGPGGEHPVEAKPIARDQIDKPVTAMFRAADTNRDGMVTLAEFQALMDARRQERIGRGFARIDTDHDGAISRAEFFEWQRRLGSAAAGDGQAVLTMEGPVAETLAPDWGEGHREMVLARIVEPLSETVLVAANTNYDAGMSLDELLAYERARFDRLDTDHDGKLTALELRALNPRRGRGIDDDGPDDRGPPPPGRDRDADSSAD